MTDRGDRRENAGRSIGSAPLSGTSPRVRVGVLGPVVVDVDGAERTVSARRPRAVLACLALHPGEAVSADRLLDEVWGDDLPATGVRAVAHQIAKLRSLLQPDRTGAGTLITTSTAGYTLHVRPDDVDAHRFDHLLDHARTALAHDAAESLTLVDQALSLWRGRPFADLGDEPLVDHETRRLEQRRLLARHTRADAQIALGRHVDAIGELEALVTDHPLEESLVELLMTALHQAGRTADALRAYTTLRRRLIDELGIEPSHNLRQLEQTLLTGDTDHPPADSPTPRGVPAALTTFVGRTDEIADVSDLLSSTRLVTLVGFGGLGKTRLAQETARAIGDRFRHGVWYVDLAPINDPSVLADTIIVAGGLRVPAGRDPIEHLLARLADREALIVLDNCEHLVDAVARIATSIVQTAQHVRILATSRLTLGVAGETIWTVHPLDATAASELFTNRAQIVRPGFGVGAADHGDLERLLDHLDGIPLAIEMAAARLAVLSIDQITEHLGDRYELLTDTRREPDARQRSLVTVMDWSYHLLDPADRELLRRMSICVDGFDLDAAIRIGTPDPAAASVPEVLDRLGRLVVASLVILSPHHGRSRYRMLEPTRQFALGQLSPDEHDHVARAHLVHYVSVATSIYRLEDSDHLAAKETATLELGNLRAAMRWAYRNGHPRLGLAIARNACSYFFLQQMYREILGWLQDGLGLVVDDHDDTLAASAIAVFAASNLTDVAAQQRAFRRLQGRHDSVDDPGLRVELLSAHASASLDTDPRAAEGFRTAALELGTSVPHRTLALLNNRIDESWITGRLDDGETILRRYEDVRLAIPAEPTRFKIAAGVAACEGRWDDVVDVCEAAGHLDPMLAASVRTLHAEALGVLGRHDDAVALIAAVEPESFERRRYFADLVRATIDLRQRRPEAAAERLASLVDEIARDGRRLAVGMQVAGLLAVAAGDLGQHETSAVLLGYAIAEQARLDIAFRLSASPLVERAIAACRATLGADHYAALAAEGARSDWNDLPTVELATERFDRGAP